MAKHNINYYCTEKNQLLMVRVTLPMYQVLRRVWLGRNGRIEHLKYCRPDRIDLCRLLLKLLLKCQRTVPPNTNENEPAALLKNRQRKLNSKIILAKLLLLPIEHIIQEKLCQTGRLN